jgi:hypothetical protein
VDTVLNVDEGIRLLRSEFGIDDESDESAGEREWGALAEQINRS